MKKKISGSLYGTMLRMVMLPMAVLGILVTLFCVHQYTKIIHSEVEASLENVCNLTLTAIDTWYPGDYTLEGDEQKTVRKGDTVLNGHFQIIDKVKEATGIDVTLFYYDTRILTTIADENGSRIIGTGCNALVLQDVYETGTPKFYEDIDVMGQRYFSYYKPVFNSDGSVVGMVFAGKPSQEIAEKIRYLLIPTVLIMIAILTIATYICFQWAHGAIVHIQVIQRFLESMSEGKFSQKIPSMISRRNDEIGRMGKSVVQMQNSFRNLVERDVLTGLNNRRFGIVKLEETQERAKITGMPFAIALGDIDFFKTVNDTYGHDCGDLVLKEVSALMRRHMSGKGFAVRWGGEEFLLVYTKARLKEASEAVEEILQEIRELAISYEGRIVRLTMSFGVTQGEAFEHHDDFIRAADRKLYYAKRHGRNRAVSVLPEETDGASGKADGSAENDLSAQGVQTKGDGLNGVEAASL
ncbi:MAG: diguanylate cyclase [Lachnospiraceae bacterium]|nr:diguanylate cyclase [Lachnospiraceae bacterium]